MAEDLVTSWGLHRYELRSADEDPTLDGPKQGVHPRSGSRVTVADGLRLQPWAIDRNRRKLRLRWVPRSPQDKLATRRNE